MARRFLSRRQRTGLYDQTGLRADGGCHGHHGIFKALTLKSDASWCRIEQDQIYFRSEQSAELRFRYSEELAQTPGLHVATITGYDGDYPLLRIVSSVVVPLRATSESGYSVSVPGSPAGNRFESVTGWKVNRHFVDVPAGASAMHLKLTAPQGQASAAQTYYLFRPDGRSMQPRYAVRVDTKNDKLESTFTVSKELTPGVWEIPVTSERAAEISPYNLEVRFDGISAPHESPTKFAADSGKAPGKLTLTNQFDRPAIVDLKGTLEGCRKSVTESLTPDKDTATIPINFSKDFGSVRIRIRTSEEDYMKFTDCAINLYDPDGHAIGQDGLAEPEAELTASNPKPSADSVACKLEIRPAFTHANKEDSASFEIDIDYLYAHPVAIDAKRGDVASTTLYPGIPAVVKYNINLKSPAGPDGSKRIGFVRAVEKLSERSIVEVLIREE
ncbi:MAG: hypothetical protein IPK83_14720 [Planctomycetes bacterium]|nr:hypothetical protein [Planctomycetota bacterium]